MGVSRAQAEINRRAVIRSAARLFRARGFDGVGVTELMGEAGLTHGGFYSHFGSKDDLVREASQRALIGGAASLERITEGSEDDPFEAIVRHYLSPAHRDHAETGCAFVALGQDAGRRGNALQQDFAHGLRLHRDAVQRAIDASAVHGKSKDSLVVFASMVGAVLLSRAVGSDTLSQQILDAVSKSLLKVPSASA